MTPARFLRSGDAAFERARRSFSSRFDGEANPPVAVIYPATAVELAAAVRDGTPPFAIRSGGHCYEGTSSRAPGGTILDLSRLDRFENRGDEAIVGPGLTMRAMNRHLARCGRSLPIATGAGVGLGGFLLGGGLGLDSRARGLACDTMVSATCVTAGGEIVTASEDEHLDLFWALRGGGNAGIVAIAEFRLRLPKAVPMRLIRCRWSWDHAAEVAARYLRWGYETDRSVTSALTLTSTGGVEMVVCIAPAPSRCDAADLLAPMLAPPLGVRPFSLRLCRPAVQTLAFGGLPLLGGLALAKRVERQLFKTCSAFVGDLQESDVREIVRALETVPPLRAAPSQPSMVRLLAGGGAIADVAPEATAAYHRRAKGLLQLDGYWTAPEDAAPTITWVRALRERLAPATVGAYSGCRDADLPDPLRAYYGGNASQLEEIRARWDPSGLFSPRLLPS